MDATKRAQVAGRGSLSSCILISSNLYHKKKVAAIA